MAEPIVRSFVIDTTQAEQNLKSLDAATTATNAALDTLYTQLIALDEQLNKLEPNTDAFNVVNTQIKALEDTITGIETGKIEAIGTAIEGIDVGNAVSEINAVGEALDTINPDTATAAINEVESAINGIDTTEATQKIGEIDTALESIDTASVVTDIDNINTALSTIDASAAVGQVESVNTALDAVDTSNVTAQIQNINSELASVDVSTAINEIAQINEEFNQIDTTNLISEITGIGDSVNEIDTSNVVSEISNINTELNAIDATNVTADINEISTAIGGIDASSAVGEISSIDNALTGIDTGEVVGQINNIGEAVLDINTNNITSVGDAVEGVVAPVNNLATATDKLNTELKETKVDTSSIDAAKQDFQELAVQEEAVTNSSKSLKAQLRELQAELAATDPDSAKYLELAAAAGELKDQIADAAEAVNTQAGSAFEKVGGSLGLFTERLVNLDFEGAAEGAELLGQNISEVKFSDVTAGIKATGQSFLTLGKALLTNPFLLLTTVVGLIITNFDKLKNVIPGVGAALEVIGEIVSFIVDGAKALSDAILGTEFVATDALNNSIAAREEALKELDRQEKRAVANAKKNGESVTAVEEKYAEDRIKTYQNIIDNAAKLTAKGIQLTEEQVKAVEEANNALFDIETEQIKKQAELAEAARKAEEKRLEDLEKKREEANKKAKERADKIKAQEKEVADAIKASKEEQFQATLSAEEKELRAVAVKYNELKEKAGANAELQKQLREQELGDLQVISDKYFQQSLETELANQTKLNEAKIAAEKAYQESFQQLQEETFAATLSEQDKEELAISQKYDKLFELAQGNREREKEVTDLQEAELNIIREKYRKEDEQKAKEKAEEDKEKADAKAQEDLEREQSIADSKIAITQQSLGAISNFIGAIAKKDEASQKRAFRAQKAISVAQATIDTYASANAAFLSTQKNPVSIAFPAAPYIAAGAAVAAGLANVATIASQEFKSTTPPATTEASPPSIDGGGGSQPAQFNPLASSFLQERPEQLTPRAYVLAGDVASQQEVRIKVEDLARIG